MNISPMKNVSFTGKLVRQKNAHGNEATKKEMIDSYDSALKKIQNAKQCSLMLDTFMHNPEVNEMIKKLPDDVEIELVGNFSLDSSSVSDTGDFAVTTPVLICYDEKIASSLKNRADEDKLVKYSYLDPVKTDGSINKKAVINWLNKLNSLYGSIH